MTEDRVYYDNEYGSADDFEDEYCDYDVCEFCENPGLKSMGLCTTECATYLEACEEAEKEAVDITRIASVKDPWHEIAKDTIPEVEKVMKKFGEAKP